MDTPHGPVRLGSTRQVAIPKEVTDLLSWKPGDRLYFLVDEEHPEMLRLVTIDRVRTWMSAGQVGDMDK
jgi:AbrB family looped-hinge helix DNA binding protein